VTELGITTFAFILIANWLEPRCPPSTSRRRPRPMSTMVYPMALLVIIWVNVVAIRPPWRQGLLRALHPPLRVPRASRSCPVLRPAALAGPAAVGNIFAGVLMCR